jgi:type II secretory pathway pseudopilin PulG
MRRKAQSSRPKYQNVNLKLRQPNRTPVARFVVCRSEIWDSLDLCNLSLGTLSSGLLSTRPPFLNGKSRRRGFSLLEVMLSLTLAIVLLGAVFTAMDQSWRLTASGREEMLRSQLARALLRKIAIDVRAVMFVPPPPSTDETEAAPAAAAAVAPAGGAPTGGAPAAAGAAAPVGDSTTPTEPSPTSIGIRGTMTQMELHISRARRDLNFSTDVDGNQIVTRTSDLLAVTYSLSLPSSGSTTGTGLIRTEGDRLIVQSVEEEGGLATQASRSQVLAPEVATIAFRYFDGTAWYEQWDSQENGYLPRAIEVILGFTPPTSSGGPLSNVVVSSSANQFRTLIVVPVADPLPPELAP